MAASPKVEGEGPLLKVKASEWRRKRNEVTFQMIDVDFHDNTTVASFAEDSPIKCKQLVRGPSSGGERLDVVRGQRSDWADWMETTEKQ